jgi:aryl-alcohol dehydrogenase-like predicted oxidoreductase
LAVQRTFSANRAEIKVALLLNWLLQRPTVCNIVIGARNEEQLRQNLGAVGWQLTPDHIRRLDETSRLTPPYPHWVGSR